MAVHAVAVWERENGQGRWRAYSPEVSQLLERADAKKLTRALLSDADPLLERYYVDVRSREQLCENSDSRARPVRRRLYPPDSPPGKGARWEWAGDAPNEWHSYDMEVQSLIERAWAKGDQTVDLSKTYLGFPYIINFCNLTQVRNNTGFVRSVRRLQQAPYPLVKITPDELAKMSGHREGGGSVRMNKKYTSNGCHKGSSSKTKKNKEDGGAAHIARTILQNLNIFSHNKGSDSSLLDVDSSSTKSGRRPSVETVCTYLTNESDQRNNSKVDLLDCSGSSDDVFLPISKNSTPPTQLKKGAIVGVDEASSGICRYVVSCEKGRESNCPLCRRSMSAQSSPLVVMLSECRHALHLDCLNALLTSQPSSPQWLYIECPVCHKIYGEKRGNQPRGTMEWTGVNVPGLGDLIQITYHIVSGMQGAEHPNPGRPYYAVGFPRVCYLPDNTKGRRILSLLNTAFHRRLIFTVGRSLTTGLEDVVTWGSISHRTEPSHALDPHFLDHSISQLAALDIT